MKSTKRTITPEQIPRILAALNSGEVTDMKALARRFGVTTWTIGRIKRAARANPES